MLVPMRCILETTERYDYAAGAFNVNAVCQAEAAVRIHEIFHSPAILQGADLANGFMGGRTDFMCSFWDMMPTFRTILNPDSETDGLDGISLLPLLEGRNGQKEHEYLYFEFAERMSQAARKGPWKLIRLDIEGDNDRYELYNIDSDPGEEHDLAAEHPDKVEELKAIMTEAHVPNSNFPLFSGE